MGIGVAFAAVGAALLTAGVAAAAGPPTGLDDVVIFAQHSASLALNDRQVAGQLVVNEPDGVAKLDKSVVMLSGTQIVADRIEVPGRSGSGPHLFDVFANTADPQIVADGSGPTAVSLPLLSFPSAPLVTPGTDPCPPPAKPGRLPGDCVVRTKDGPVTLPPGHYNSLTIKTRAAIYFAGGTYHFRSLRGLGNARMYFNGPSTLYVAERASFGNRTIMAPPTESLLNPRCIVLRVAGVEPLKIGGTSDIEAMIEAPNAFMRLGSRGTYRGQFVAASVKVGVNVLLQTAPALAGPCE